MNDLSVTEEEVSTKLVYLGTQRCSGIYQEDNTWISVTTLTNAILKCSKDTTRVSIRNKVVSLIKRRNNPIETKLITRDVNKDVFNLLYKTGGVTKASMVKIIPLADAREIFEKLT
jgi:hypothetical protein